MQLLFAVDATGCAGKFPSQKLGIPSRAVGVRRRRQTDFCQSRLRLDKLSTAQMDEREETDHLVRSAKPTPLGSFPSALIHEASRSRVWSAELQAGAAATLWRSSPDGKPLYTRCKCTNLCTGLFRVHFHNSWTRRTPDVVSRLNPSRMSVYLSIYLFNQVSTCLTDFRTHYCTNTNQIFSSQVI